MNIDGFAHYVPPALRDRVVERAGNLASLVNWKAGSALTELDRRLETMNELGIDAQVLTTGSPPLESILDPPGAREMARLANDAMAEDVRRHPDRFIPVATVPLADPDWAAAEIERCVRDLGMAGVLVYSSSRGAPLDSEVAGQVFAALEELDVPAWLHPEWAQRRPDYPGEPKSRYGLDLVLGWPYETSVAVSRMVLSGVMRRHPDLKVIIHHAGAMIPFFLKRIELHYPADEELGRTEAPQVRGADLAADFRKFYADTVTQGEIGALMNAYEVYGADRMVLGSDAPFGPRGGSTFMQVALEALNAMPIPEPEKEQLRWSNMAALCKLPAVSAG